MTHRQFAPAEIQPRKFVFSRENETTIKNILAKYPEGRTASALLPLLNLAQRQHNGWLPEVAIRYVADLLNIPEIKAFEVASFYSMFNLSPRGFYLLQLCRTTPCWLKGSDDLARTCTEYLGIDFGETTSDGLFSLVEVECLGACINGPVIQINDDFYENLSASSLVEVLRALKSTGDVNFGPAHKDRVSNSELGRSK